MAPQQQQQQQLVHQTVAHALLYVCLMYQLLFLLWAQAFVLLHHLLIAGSQDDLQHVPQLTHAADTADIHPIAAVAGAAAVLAVHACCCLMLLVVCHRCWHCCCHTQLLWPGYVCGLLAQLHIETLSFLQE
jgi:hypothetical protein